LYTPVAVALKASGLTPVPPIAAAMIVVLVETAIGVVYKVDEVVGVVSLVV